MQRILGGDSELADKKKFDKKKDSWRLSALAQYGDNVRSL
tara:strand:+ start:704 stop:823 length:120 start_codon:yes stop_codon:yes gene_type:complete